MTQLNLFGDGAQVLLDDSSGRIELRPNVIPAQTATRWFELLRDDVPWKDGRRMMYEREVAVPRLRAHYEADDPELPPVLLEALQLARSELHAPFDSIGLNLYRDHRDSVAPHSDKLDDLVRGEPIALLSLGATRRMTIRAKRLPRRVLQVDLEARSLLIMSWETQLHYDHSIPKQRESCAPRMSLAFRVRGPRKDA